MLLLLHLSARAAFKIETRVVTVTELLTTSKTYFPGNISSVLTLLLESNKSNKSNSVEKLQPLSELRCYRRCYLSRGLRMHSVTVEAQQNFYAAARLSSCIGCALLAPSMSTNDLEVDALALTCDERERAFCREYMIDRNATQAVYRCGCYAVNSDHAASSQGTRLMSRPCVTALLAVLSAQHAARTSMTADAVLHEMSLLSHSNVGHYVIDDNGQIQLTAGAPEGAMSAIKSVKRKKTIRQERESAKGADDGAIVITYDVELTLWDKPEPLKLMGRHVGLFPNKVEVTGKGGGPIETVTEIKRTIVKSPVEPVKVDA